MKPDVNDKICRVGIKLPVIVDDSLAIVSTTAVGLSMFTAGA